MLRYLLVLLFALPALAQETAPPAPAWLQTELTAAERFKVINRFELLNQCRPMDLSVEFPSEDAREIGLTMSRIRMAMESRLRSARLYKAREPAKPIMEMEADEFEAYARETHLLGLLYINVHVVGQAFSVDLKYMKTLFDPVTLETQQVGTWETSSNGTHGGDAEFILSNMSGHMDKFLVAYLLVNEEACE